MVKNDGILIVDDTDSVRKLIKKILVNNGYKILGEATNGLKAIEQYIKLSPRLTIMDINMPELDGIEAVKEIIKLDKEANVVMCSSMTDPDTIKEAIRAGAKDYIVKPFKENKFAEFINKIYNDGGK